MPDARTAASLNCIRKSQSAPHRKRPAAQETDARVQICSRHPFQHVTQFAVAAVAKLDIHP